MSVLDNLLISAYAFLDSAASKEEIEKKQQSDAILSEFDAFDDGATEVGCENPQLYRYFTSDHTHRTMRKSVRSSIVDISSGSEKGSWMMDEDTSVME